MTTWYRQMHSQPSWQERSCFIKPHLFAFFLCLHTHMGRYRWFTLLSFPPITLLTCLLFTPPATDRLKKLLITTTDNAAADNNAGRVCVCECVSVWGEKEESEREGGIAMNANNQSCWHCLNSPRASSEPNFWARLLPPQKDASYISRQPVCWKLGWRLDRRADQGRSTKLGAFGSPPQPCWLVGGVWTVSTNHSMALVLRSTGLFRLNLTFHHY